MEKGFKVCRCLHPALRYFDLTSLGNNILKGFQAESNENQQPRALLSKYFMMDFALIEGGGG